MQMKAIFYTSAIFGTFASMGYTQGTGQFPTTIEVDLIVPRAATTYAPVDPFPIVFAIQGAPLAFDLTYALQWRLFRGDDDSTGLDDKGTAQVSRGSSAPNDPFIVINTTSALTQFGDASNNHHDWVLRWQFVLANGCAQPNGAAFALAGDFQFSSGKDGITLNKDTITTCPTLGGGMVVNGKDANGCPQVDNAPVTTGTPCAVKLTDQDVNQILSGKPSSSNSGGNTTTSSQGGGKSPVPTKSQVPSSHNAANHAQATYAASFGIAAGLVAFAI